MNGINGTNEQQGPQGISRQGIELSNLAIIIRIVGILPLLNPISTIFSVQIQENAPTPNMLFPSTDSINPPDSSTSTTVKILPGDNDVTATSSILPIIVLPVTYSPVAPSQWNQIRKKHVKLIIKKYYN
ncbi:MAG TPA: hypothetical protein VIY08_06210 [Candidatus Nitrosocosmicus sp.]